MKKKKTVNSQSKKQWKKILKICLITVAIVIASISVYLGVTVFQQISGFSKEKLLNTETSSQISVIDNKTYHSYGKDGARKNVAYEDIPQVMIDAIVAAEDSRYFEHNGFDLPRIVKAFMGNIVSGGITGGGSTITQQVIKQSFYPNAVNGKETFNQSIQRKIGEIILSVKATSSLTKEEVLELYLNKIYFGYGNKAIGIYAASRYYFDKSVQNLTLPEAALLAGALNSPNNYDPFRDLQKAQKRRDTILDLMKLHGYITAEECEKTKAIPVQNTLKSNPINSGGKYQAYADMVTREVIERTGYDPNETPMKIYTYMNPDLQGKLDDIATSKSYKFYDKDIQAGACVQESKNGRIVGVLSARDYSPMGKTNAYHKNGVKKGGYGQVHQPGSSLKPIISYASAFEFLDYSTAHYVHDVPLSGTYSPKNHDGKFHGDLSISDALSNSWNLAAIQTYLDVYREVGEEKIVKYLEGFGFDMAKEKLATGYAIGGWDYGTTPKEEAAAYAAIANGGTYIEPHTVAKIELTTTGEIIELDKDLNKDKKQALSEESAFMIRDVMTNYVRSSGNYSRLNLGLQIGAKTGTTNYPRDNKYIPDALKGKSKDSWMSAYSPDYAWSVWVGYPEDVAREKKKWLRSGVDSKNISALIAKYVHGGKLKNSYPARPNGVVKATCVSGIYPYIKPGSGVPQDRIVSGWFKKGNTPSGSANGAQLNSLETFTATLQNGKINVNFKPYNPESMTKEDAKPTKVYQVNGRSYTLPYLGDINQIYGRVVYVAEVSDASGNIVHTEKLNNPTATLKFTPSTGTYTVTGYYAFEKGEGTSNKIQTSLTLEGTLGASYSFVSQNATQLVLLVNVPSGNKVTITAGGATEVLTSSRNVTFSNLTAGSTITFKESTSDGKTQELTPYIVPTPPAQ